MSLRSSVAEGAHIRLGNRRLEREVHKLETEVNYLRTQPAVGRREPDSLPGNDAASDRRGSRSGADTPVERRPPPSAPVYGGGGDGPEDDDDEIYTGGRAV